MWSTFEIVSFSLQKKLDVSGGRSFPHSAAKYPGFLIRKSIQTQTQRRMVVNHRLVLLDEDELRRFLAEARGEER
jgi:hypothetical protein